MSLIKKIFDSDLWGILISIIVGLAGITLSLIILWQGYFNPIPKVEDYVVKDVTFEKCSIDENNNISLKSEGESYKLNHTLLTNTNTKDSKLLFCNGLETTVWIHKNAESPFEIRGIKTSSYHIPIEKGLVLDDHSQHIIFGWIMFIVGFIALIIGVISKGELLTF